MSEADLPDRLASFAARWHPGQLLAASAIDARTDYEGGLVLRTTVDPPGLEVVLPGQGRITFAQPPRTNAVITSDIFAFTTAAGRTTGCVLDAHHLLISGPVSFASADGSIRSLSRDGRHLIGPAASFDERRIGANLGAAMAERAGWLFRQPMLARHSGLRQRALFKALAVMKGQLCSAEGAIRHPWSTPDRWPHRDMWLWDTVFHAIGWRHVDPTLARAMIDAVFDGQRADGFIPHQLSPRHGPSAITQPPLLAFGIRLIDDAAPDDAWLRQHYPRLAAYVTWDLAHRDRDGLGLVEWLIEGDPISRSGESGMDNSPRFDFHYPARLAVTDFNAYLALECETLAGFAERLGLSDAHLWRQRHERLCRLINRHLWSEEAEFYCDYDPASGSLSPVLASAGFLPLICGAPSPDRATALLRHLRDPAMFGTAFPVPSIAARDHAHYVKDMWRGPTWVNVNWLIARGLERYATQGEQFAAAACALDRATIAEIEDRFAGFGTFFEFYDDGRGLPPPQLLRKGECNPGNPFRQVIHDYGWTTTLYVDLLARCGRISGFSACPREE